MREIQDRIMLKAPVVGSILTKAAIARFARTLSTMFSAGVPLVEALESVRVRNVKPPARGTPDPTDAALAADYTLGARDRLD